MGTFNVSLKTLTDRVSMEVVYTPKELDQMCGDRRSEPPGSVSGGLL